MDFYNKEEYSIEDIEQLIENEVEENIHLDYKAAGALEKNEKKRNEITKDVSAFANSDGGIIIYGISEENHKPTYITPIDGNQYTKEWLENVILLIQPRVEGVVIFPIRNDNLANTLYVVKIPRSTLAPHMANDKRYYKRFNFSSVPMEDYEVKDLYNRISTPDLEIIGCNFYINAETENYIEYGLWAKIGNYGQKVCESYKLNFYINRMQYCDISYKPLENKNSYTIINHNRLKLSSPSQEPIFPNEELDLGKFQIKVEKKDLSLFYDKLMIDLILYYPGGSKRLAYIPSQRKFIEDESEIEKHLEHVEQESIKENIQK